MLVIAITQVGVFVMGASVFVALLIFVAIVLGVLRQQRLLRLNHVIWPAILAEPAETPGSANRYAAATGAVHLADEQRQPSSSMPASPVRTQHIT